MDNEIAARYASATIKYRQILAALPDGYFADVDEDMLADMQKIALAMFASGHADGALAAQAVYERK